MKTFTTLNAKLNIYLGFEDMNQDDKSIRFVVNNIAAELHKGTEASLTRIAYDAQIEEIKRTKVFIDTFGTEYFFTFCKVQINELSKSINQLLQMS